jgi:NAD(P)H-hydrate epimerase
MGLSREQSREVDRRALADCGLPGVVLMENAGRSAAEVLVALDPADGLKVICCGKGNNGGDGFVVARWLGQFGVPAEVLLFARPEELAGDAAVMFHALRHTDVPVSVVPPGDAAAVATSRLADAAWVVDALFGTGLTGPVRAPFDAVIAAINAAGKPILSLDIPSGLDCDTGEPLGPTVRADHTVTFVDRKVGFDAPAAAAWVGRVHVGDIGVPAALVESVRQG